MPELPEVEQVRRGLEPRLVGKTIQSVEVLWENIISEPAVEEFKRLLVGQTFEKIERRGKFLVFYLTEVALISHLRMEGKYHLVSKELPLDKHTHVIFNLDGQQQLRYNDVRKFGRMSIVSKNLAYDHRSLNKLGPEPTEEDLSVDWMITYLKNRKKSIKGLLLDQNFVAGIGNIYTDEILFRTKIHPETPGGQLKEKEIKLLREKIIEVIEEAILSGGTTIRSYENSFGDPGSYQDFLNVYGKAGEPCPVCHTLIEKIKVAGRGTHYCPSCQKERK